ncbi:hypothetical protein VQ042_23650 [Aurantimonas sp. A2-1-M11]|uniref:hypothetical protein n=1 Tax=Aurantimonas sp. A2-1-M11 TaxID=3113712 RepID=UPI002F921414
MAATELAIIMPFLCFGLIAMADLGLAARERLAMEHKLRIAVEGSLRFGTNITEIEEFLGRTNDSQTAYNSVAITEPANATDEEKADLAKPVEIIELEGCRDGTDQSEVTLHPKGSGHCPNPEKWMRMVVSRVYQGIMFGDRRFETKAEMQVY